MTYIQALNAIAGGYMVVSSNGNMWKLGLNNQILLYDLNDGWVAVAFEEFERAQYFSVLELEGYQTLADSPKLLETSSDK